MRPSVAAPSRLALFVCLWAFAQLYNELHYELMFSSAWDIALSVASLLLLAFPTSVPLLAVAGALLAGAVFEQMPIFFHHHLMNGFTGVVILLGAPAVLFGADRERWLFGPLRWMTIALYFTAAFHKLNADFFASESSCGQAFLAYSLDMFGLPVRLASLPGLGSLVGFGVELAIPLLLLWPRTRSLGVMAAGLFHFEMAVLGYTRFAAIMIALIALFVDVDQLARVAPVRPRWLRAGRGAVLAFAAGYVIWKLLIGPLPRTVFHVADWMLTWATSFICLSLAMMAPFLRRPGPTPKLFGLAPAMAVAPVLVVGAGLSPYLGLSTLHSFSMYSNLRTEGEGTNHLLMGRQVEVFGYQRDLVEIRGSNVPEFQQFADAGLLIPWVGFRQKLAGYLGGEEPVRVAYLRNGRRRDVADAAADPQLSEPLSVFERKLLSFRPVEKGGARDCTY